MKTHFQDKWLYTFFLGQFDAEVFGQVSLFNDILIWKFVEICES